MLYNEACSFFSNEVTYGLMRTGLMFNKITRPISVARKLQKCLPSDLDLVISTTRKGKTFCSLEELLYWPLNARDAHQWQDLIN